MKHNYKFRIDEPVPSDEQIDRHRNFDRVLADHRNITEPLYRRPLYKNPRAFIGLVLVLVIAFLVFQAVEEEDQAMETANAIEEFDKVKDQRFLEPAGLGFDVPAETFEVSPGKEKEYELPSGVVIRIPANAFPSDDNPVQVSVREFEEPLAAVLAGVPLDFEESKLAIPSQIFQITMTSNGKPIDLAPNAEIKVEMTGLRNPETDHDVLYVLDLNEKIWKNSRSEMNMEERPLDSPHSPVIIHDGFNVVEFEDDGSIRNRPVTSDSAIPGQGIQWVRSFESTGNGYFMCGHPGHPGTPNLSLRLKDVEGKALSIFALYQVSRDGKSARTYWPQDSKFTYEVVTTTPGSKLFGFTEEGHLAWTEVPQRSDEEVVEIQPTVSTQEVKDLQTLKNILSIESE